MELEQLEKLAEWMAQTPLAPDLGQQVAQYASVYDLDPLAVWRYLELYIAKFRQGPYAFWAWYQFQRRLYDDDFIREPPYPHEVFPALVGEEGELFYEFVEQAQLLFAGRDKPTLRR